MRISDWSSDVCSSDLEDARQVEIAVGSDPAEAVVIERADRGGGKAQQEAVESEVVKQSPQLRRRLVGIGAAEVGRSEERRVGIECVRPCRSRCSTANQIKK